MPIYQGSWSVDIKINVTKIVFAVLPSKGVRTVKRQNGNGKRPLTVRLF